jgi:hypothetical protein
MCVCITEFVVVLFKMLSCSALSVVSGTKMHGATHIKIKIIKLRQNTEFFLPSVNMS